MTNRNTVLIDGKAIDISDTKTSLSFKSPSPKWASKIFNVWVLIATLTTLAMATFADEIPDGIEPLINKIIVFGTGAMRIITKAFGLELKED